MKFIFTLVACLAITLAQAQIIAVKTFPLDSKPARNITFSLQHGDAYHYTIQVDTIEDVSRDFIFKSDLQDPETYETALLVSFKKALFTIDSTKPADTLLVSRVRTAIQKGVTQFFFWTQARAALKDETPIAGYLKTSSAEIPLSLAGRHIKLVDSKKAIIKADFTKLDIEVKDGLIQNLLLLATLKDTVEALELDAKKQLMINRKDRKIKILEIRKQDYVERIQWEKFILEKKASLESVPNFKVNYDKVRSIVLLTKKLKHIESSIKRKNDRIRILTAKSKKAVKHLYFPGTQLKFMNSFPIAFSTKLNLDNLKKYSLVDRFYQIVQVDLSDVFTYVQNLQVDTKDYSPRNDVYSLYPNSTVELKRDPTSQLFNVRVYSDFVGFDSKAPNGLVQFELDKVLSLNTYRGEVAKFQSRLINGAWGAYFIPTFRYSKLEQNNRALPIMNPTAAISDTTVSTLSLRNHERYSINVLLNVFLLDFAGLKCIGTFNVGAGFANAVALHPVKKTEENINSFILPVELKVEYNPEYRYGVHGSYTLNYYREASPYRQLDFDGDRQNRNWFATAEIGAFFRTSSSSTLFFRYRLNYIPDNPATNFQQIQLGFSRYLLNNNK